MSSVIMATEVEARRRQERLRMLASSVRDGMDKIAALVTEAKESNDHEALGYRSWTEYLSDTLGAEQMQLAAPERREVAALLAGEGMSSRTIADIVGATHTTVQRDLRLEQDVPVERPERVMSRDGIERPSSRPGPPKAHATPPRRALVDTAREVGIDLRKLTDRLVRIAADDRLARNKDEVAAHLRHHLVDAIKVCQDLNDQFQ